MGIVGCVPMTSALNTLESSHEHTENIQDDTSVVSQIAQLKQVTSKAWIAVVDGGSLYDPMAAALQTHQVPTFRTIDRALSVLRKYCRSRLQHER